MKLHEITMNRPKRRVKLTSKGKVRKRRSIRWGSFYITMGKANTVVSFTDATGDVLFWESGGSCGYKGRKKGTALAGRVIALKVARRAYRMGIREAKIIAHGWGKGRRSAVRAIGTYLPPKMPKRRPAGGRRKWRESLKPSGGPKAPRLSPSEILERLEGALEKQKQGRPRPRPYPPKPWNKQAQRPWRNPRAFRIRVLVCTSSPPHNGCRPPRKRHIRRRKPRRLVDLYSYLFRPPGLRRGEPQGRK